MFHFRSEEIFIPRSLADLTISNGWLFTTIGSSIGSDFEKCNSQFFAFGVVCICSFRNVCLYRQKAPKILAHPKPLTKTYTVFIRTGAQGAYFWIFRGRLFEGGRLLNFHYFSRKDIRILSKFIGIF